MLEMSEIADFSKIWEQLPSNFAYCEQWPVGIQKLFRIAVMRLELLQAARIISFYPSNHAKSAKSA